MMNTLSLILSHPLFLALAPGVLTWLLDKYSDKD